MKPGKAISSDMRDDIRKDYLLMDLTNEELGKKYKVHPNTIYNLAKRENWSQLKELISISKYIDAVIYKVLHKCKTDDSFSWKL